MAVGVLISIPGATQQLYDQVNDVMQIPDDDPPHGMILHSAGPMPDGWYIYDIWESREDFQHFSQEKVAPAVQQITGAPMSGEPQFFEIADLVVAGQTVT